MSHSGEVVHISQLGPWQRLGWLAAMLVAFGFTDCEQCGSRPTGGMGSTAGSSSSGGGGSSNGGLTTGGGATAGATNGNGASGGDGGSSGAGSNTPALYLKSDIATQLSFEIDHISGHAPKDAALSKFVAALQGLHQENLLRKPAGINFVLDDTLAAPMAESDHAYSFAEVQQLVATHRNTQSNGNTAWAYILYLDGHDENDTNSGGTLGYAWGGDKFVMFPDTIAKYCNPGPLSNKEKVCSTGEASVLVHEFGHLMGLVDNGLAMTSNHKDSEHGAHDSNQNCIMYWTVNGTDFLQNLTSLLGSDPAVPAFDAQCKADMAAVHQ